METLFLLPTFKRETILSVISSEVIFKDNNSTNRVMFLCRIGPWKPGGEEVWEILKRD